MIYFKDKFYNIIKGFLPLKNQNIMIKDLRNMLLCLNVNNKDIDLITNKLIIRDLKIENKEIDTRHYNIEEKRRILGDMGGGR